MSSSSNAFFFLYLYLGHPYDQLRTVWVGLEYHDGCHLGGWQIMIGVFGVWDYVYMNQGDARLRFGGPDTLVHAQCV